MQSFPYLLVLACLLATHALSLKISDRFTVTSTCTSEQEEILDTVTTETLELVDNAMTSIENLNAGGALDEKTGRERKQFVNIQRAAEWAFGIRRENYNSALSERDSRHLGHVYKRFERFRNVLVEGRGGPKRGVFPHNSHFNCNDDSYEWETNAFEVFGEDYISPEDFCMTIEGYFKTNPGSVKSAKGVWKDTDESHMSGTKFNFLYGSSEGICRNEFDEAQTFIPHFDTYSTIIFCPTVWGKNPEYNRDLSSINDAIEKSNTDAGPKLEMNFFDKMRTIAGVFFHEMMHLIDPKIIDEVVEPMADGKGRLAYGSRGCKKLALELGDDGYQRTLGNADSYHLFAIMAYAIDATFVES